MNNENENKDLEQDILNPDDFETAETETSNDKEVEEKAETSESTDDNVDKSKEDEEKKKEAERNSYYAKLRREKEAKEKEERERKIKKEAKLEAELGILKTNPFTNEPIRDEEDLEIYKLQKEIDDNGGDPVNDLGKKIAEKNRKDKEERLAKEKEENAKRDEISKDIAEFHEKHPEVNLEELANDKDYIKFTQNKVGRWTTEEMYFAYKDQQAKNTAKKESEDKKELVDETSKKVSKTPSSNNNGKTAPKSIKDMTDEEFNKYWNEKYN